MGGAVLVTLISFRFILRRPHPLLGGGFQLPARSDIDVALIAGSAIFGIGWGLGGFCPGPGIASIAQGSWEAVVFALGLAGGMLLFRFLGRRPDSCFQ